MEKISRLFRNVNIYIADSPVHGRGVFTDVDILPGEIIEQAHVIHPKDKDVQKTDENYLQYFFFWPTLSKEQYLCHNEIIYRESRWNHRAVGNIGGTKQAYGLYQMKLKSLHTSTHVRQYWKYMYYVIHRYGLTDGKAKDPNYCKALHHLKTKGWQ